MIGVVFNMIDGNTMAAVWAFASTLLLISRLAREYRN